MRYNEFRDRLQDALQEAKLFFHHADRVEETVALEATERHWEAYVWRSVPQRAEPFHISAKISFKWNPFNAARGYTCEEDLLTELFGRNNRPTKTERRFVRVDLGLSASLPYGSTTPMPEAHVFGPWTASVGEKFDALFTDIKERGGRVVAVYGGHGDLDVEGHCTPVGVVTLKGVSIFGFNLVRVPRVWDHPDRREKDKDIGQDLDRLAQRFKAAYEGWTAAVAELATWIRYAPPPPEAKPVEPWFGEEDEDGEDERGPETAH